MAGDPTIPRHVVFSGSTGEGLEQLAEAENASVIVFGSDYLSGATRTMLNAARGSVLVIPSGVAVRL